MPNKSSCRDTVSMQPQMSSVSDKVRNTMVNHTKELGLLVKTEASVLYLKSHSILNRSSWHWIGHPRASHCLLYMKNTPNVSLLPLKTRSQHFFCNSDPCVEYGGYIISDYCKEPILSFGIIYLTNLLTKRSQSFFFFFTSFNLHNSWTRCQRISLTSLLSADESLDLTA